MDEGSSARVSKSLSHGAFTTDIIATMAQGEIPISCTLLD
jgi:hypothetical protein